jgi:hypothetical protein
MKKTKPKKIGIDKIIGGSLLIAALALALPLLVFWAIWIMTSFSIPYTLDTLVAFWIVKILLFRKW